MVLWVYYIFMVYSNKREFSPRPLHVVHPDCSSNRHEIFDLVYLYDVEDEMR